MRVWISDMKDGKKISLHADVEKDSSQLNREMQLVRVFPEIAYQSIQGFGGAFTDAAGYVYSQMPDTVKEEFLGTYFGSDGLHYTMGRTSVDSCDFGTEMYAADNDPNDDSLSHMDFSRCDRYVMPLYRDAVKRAGYPVGMMLTPWSAPAYMKDNGSRIHGGKLLPAYAQRWAEYIVKSVVHCIRYGMDVQLLSVQNEPQASQTWDSMLMTAEEEGDFIRRHLVPALREADILDKVCLLIWDHNKEAAWERARITLSDPAVKQAVGGVAFHWYTGDHFDNLDLIRQSFPGKRLVFSEGCVEHSVFGEDAEKPGAVKYAHEYIGDLNHGADTFLDWNLLLDEQGGPNHVGNFCDAPVMYDRNTKKLQKKLSLDYIAHFSKYMLPGSVRTAVSSCAAGLEAAAARNPDGSLAVVILNRTGKQARFFLDIHGAYYPLCLDEGAILTAIV